MSSAVRDTVPFLDLGPTTQAVAPVVVDGWNETLTASAFIGGPAVSEFEDAFARFCSTSQAVGTANGTDALHLTLRALGIGGGDEVLVRWAPGLGDQGLMPIERYLSERIDLQSGA